MPAFIPLPISRATLLAAGVAVSLTALVGCPGDEAAALPVVAAGPAQGHLCNSPDEHILHTKPKVRSLPERSSLRVFKSGGLIISEVYIPAKSPLQLQVWTSPSLTKSEQPTKSLAAHKQGVAVMNADPFDASRGAIPHGVEVTDGVVDKAERTPTNAVFMGKTGHQLSQGSLALTGSVSVGKRHLSLTGLNWQDLAGSGVNAYTVPWGYGSHPVGTVQVIVKNGRVSGVRHDAKSVPPHRGVDVLTGVGKAASFLDRLRKGQKINVRTGFKTIFHNTDTIPAFKVWDAVDHDTPFYLNGKRYQVDCSNPSSLQHYDRTGLGFDRKGDYFLVTTSGTGSTATDMQYYLGQLGAFDADGFDNDTSTTLAVRHKLGGKIYRVDKPNSAYQRAVPNYLGVG